MKTTVVIPAAGSGTRMKADANKILMPLAGKPAIVWCVERFQTHKNINDIIIVGSETDLPRLKKIFEDKQIWNKIKACVSGGTQRQDSVRMGLEYAAMNPPDHVLVHDGARPLCSHGVITRVIEALTENIAVVPMLPIHDTVRRVKDKGTEIVDRNDLFRSQTPQGFHFQQLLAAHRKAHQLGIQVTDDGQLLEQTGVVVKSVVGDERNLKITSPDDLLLAEAWVRFQE